MKLKFFLMLAGLLLLFTAQAQQKNNTDRIETAKGPITIQPVLHGTVALTWGGKTIYVDPYGGAAAFKGIAPPDLILITDIHGDHLDLKTLEALKTDKATLVVPQAVAEQLPASYKNRIVVLHNGQKTEQLGIDISAIPMYNLPETEDSRHTKGRGNGYLLQFADKTVYLSGDTEDIPEMRALRDIDVAFVCMNLPYTMDIDQAASAVLEFKPAIVYPYHYRGQDGLSDVEAFKRKVNEGNQNIEVRLRNWYPENAKK
ncbi:MBL fold metallo-hydrolase [Pontibacter ramchanderi]|uniref:L-ascorbate metabolism protein UlaG (Beta-lactamase superfamily) n=1 Tax=Pontibacter ramchanderi TaxID=1179743 RepID=A0A2N3U7C5_9BACT|nr:MBL fold metallo-hydrolase [Pontibacter ramchanderi]PKV62651.1 L-ascorbate metabolism protein UlaG (beta-lactamase superfamily) [Pontibacter ramchanderi]